jgi:hypothetical protein
MEPRKSRAVSTEPETKLTQLEEVTTDLMLLAKCLSKTKYYAEACKEYMTTDEIRIIRKYAK